TGAALRPRNAAQFPVPLVLPRDGAVADVGDHARVANAEPDETPAYQLPLLLCPSTSALPSPLTSPMEMPAQALAGDHCAHWDRPKPWPLDRPTHQEPSLPNAATSALPSPLKSPA